MSGIYSPNLWDNMEPASVRGGKTRAQQAKRDALGRFMPAHRETEWNLDPEHGVPGGRKRAATAKRVKGRFA